VPPTFESIADADTVTRDGDRLVVRSAHANAAWRVGRYRRVLVHFRGARYAVVGASPEQGGHRYTLEPWVAPVNELPSLEVTYDEAYVREREADFLEQRKRHRQAWVLLPVWPLLGFLPRGVKTLLQERFGLEPVTATRRSVVFEMALLLFLLVYLVVPVPGVAWLGVAYPVILIDALMRSAILFEDSSEPFGVFEWVLHPEVVTLVWRAWRTFRERKKRRDVD
jgi:hypothetical protein